MSERIPFRPPNAERGVFLSRLLLALGFVLLLTAVLLFRYFSLQILHYEDYRTESERNRVHLQPVAPTRGLIYDRNGVLLADNLPSSTLVVIKEQVPDLEHSLLMVQDLLAIEADDLDKFRRRLAARRLPYGKVPLKFHLSERDIAVLAVNQFRLPGFEVQAELKRYYPQGDHFAHVIGYVGRINERELKQLDPVNYASTHIMGKTGIEKYYEAALHGEVGAEHVETNARGRVLRSLDRSDPKPGKDLILHLDADLQRLAHEALGEERGALVAIDPNSGGVLVFASTPGFDPNLFVGGISSVDYRALNSSPDKPLYNRAVMGQYPPGSTIKPLIGLAGLEYEVVTPYTVVSDPGWYRLPKKRRQYRDWKRGGHGSRIDLHTALEQSCDIYYYDLANKLGVDRIHEFGDRFAIGRRTEIDLPVERPGLLPSRQWKRDRLRQPWYPGETLIAGIGQGYVLTTPLQLAVSTAAIANRGRVFSPRLLKSVSGELPEPVVSSQVTLRREEHWDVVWRGMEAVVHGKRGTAKRISRDLPYRIAGKTGTAQVVGIAQGERYDASALSKRNRDHALFIAFAPIEAPRIALAVIVENGEHGSSTAAPIARKVMDAYLLDNGVLSPSVGTAYSAAPPAGGAGREVNAVNERGHDLVAR